MKRLANGWAILTALLVGGVIAVPTPALASKVVASAAKQQPGTLHVYDQGKLFTEAGIDKAKSTFGNTKFDHGLTLTIDTYKELPEGKKGEYSKEKEGKFFKDWAVTLAKDDRAKGIYVLVCRSPGYVTVIADKTTRERGFTNEDEKKLRDTLLASFRDAAKEKDAAKQSQIRDTALLASVNFVAEDMKNTTVRAMGNPAHSDGPTTQARKTGMGIGGWLCLGLGVLLCVWLVVGLIRAFTGGGGGGGFGGGGGGGGGFGTSLLGGLFGAMAGMWIYNHMFGAGGMFGSSDAYAGDGGYSGDTGADTSGDGDFSGDTGAGGSYDDGGGDFGGGGGDFGGGDFGGGDFGGGDF